MWSRLHAIYWNFRCLKTGLGHLHIHFWPARNAVGGTMQLSRARALCGQQHRSCLTPGDGACGCGRRSSRPHPAPPALALAAVLVPAFVSPSPGVPELTVYRGGLPRAQLYGLTQPPPAERCLRLCRCRRATFPSSSLWLGYRGAGCLGHAGFAAVHRETRGAPGQGGP